MQEHTGTRRRMPWWPLLLIAAPAAVALWSGWVGLAELCGFGPVRPLPGIDDSFRINTAITLPVGLEAYAAVALGAWLMPGTGPQARTFARRSALLALALGCVGQITYYLLAAAHVRVAPWPIVMVVACMPIVTLAFATALVHLLRADETVQPEPAREDPPPAPEEPADETETADETVPDVPTDKETAARAWYAATVALGNPASANLLATKFDLTRAEATKLRTEVAVGANGHAPPRQETVATPGDGQ
jgi:hypothetical protein